MYNQQQQQPVQDESLKDINIQNMNDQPLDSVSHISWYNNPQNMQQTSQKYFTASCWDGSVRLYELNIGYNQFALNQKTTFQNNEPVLSSSWKSDQSKIFIASDSTLKSIDMSTGQIVNIGAHTAGISEVFYIPQSNQILTTSYDATVKIWSESSPQPVQSWNIGSKIYKADFKFPFLLLGLQNEKIFISDLQKINPNLIPQQILPSPLGDTSQIQSLSLAPNLQGLAIGSIDGRANLSKFQEEYNTGKYKLENIMTFKCHKTEPSNNNYATQNKSSVVYPVNCIGFNARNDKFLYTAGGEGNMFFWDFEAKNKIKSFHFGTVNPVSAGSIDASGHFLAYSLGYDWHEGIQGANKYSKPKIVVHQIQDNELKYVKQ